MKNIGIVLPYVRSGNFVTRIINRARPEIVPVAEYGFNFIVTNDRQNCTKIFNKNNVEDIIILTDAEIETCDFHIINGDVVYKRMLPEFVRKMVKSKGENTSVTVVDKNMSVDGSVIADKLCSFCRTVCIATDSAERAESVSDGLMQKYGAVTEIKSGKAFVDTDIAVVIDRCENKFSDRCVIIDKDRGDRSGIINDFYIPFKVKPPYGISNIVFAECIDLLNTKNIDIL